MHGKAVAPRRAAPAARAAARPTARRAPRRAPIAAAAHAHGEVAADRPRPGEKKGFVEEMRFVAMRLHTKDQAPKEGQREAAPTPWFKVEPSREGYLRFLAESLAVYEALEQGVQSRDEYAAFRKTGLERTGPLRTDLAWFKSEYGMDAPVLVDDGPGRTYARLLTTLAATDPPAFICHFYNIYFAHTAGGRFIGIKMADLLLNRHELEFYKYDGDYKPLLDGVRTSIDALAATWSRADKDRCLAETEKSFEYSGKLLRVIVEPIKAA